MSRSFKKTPVCKDNGRGGKGSHRRTAKREANRKVRLTSEVPSGKAYRKLYNPWNIYDYIFRETFQEHLDEYWKWETIRARRRGDEPQSLDWREHFRKWSRQFRMK